MSNMDSMLDMFIYENNQLTDRLDDLLMEADKSSALASEDINEIFRIMHTIKGSAAMMNLESISTLAHSIEDMFSYIRENYDTINPDWDAIIDIAFSANDFFRAETQKLSLGQEADGSNESILRVINDYLPVLKGTTGQAQIVTALEQAPAAGEAPTDIPCLMARVFFEDGCKMENIRAYQIVSRLTELSAHVESIPEDLLEDVSDEIIKNGVTLYIYTALPLEEIKNAINSSIFIKTLELAPCDVSSAAAKPGAQSSAQSEARIESTSSAAAAPVRQGEAPKQSYISVNVDKLDRLLELVGEIVIAQAMVTKNPDLEGLNLPNFEAATAMLRKNTDELQDLVMSVRMLPVSSTFHKLSRIVRDLSKKTGKAVNLVIRGEETELDKNILDNLSDPLMHIVRNSMDHGLEDNAEARIAAGKVETGTIILEAKNAGSHVVISVSDDGRGLDKEKILNKARSQGILTKPESEYTDREIYNLIMLPGFSTKDQVTDLSGRGVGMDVVKKNIEKIGGLVSVDSVPGLGMTVNIKIPLTLAILAGMEISVGGNVFIVPTLSIRQTIKPNISDVIVDPEGNEMFMVRGEVFPIIRLHQVFGITESHFENLEDGIILVCEDEAHTICLFCDALLGEQQVVVKPIPPYISRLVGSITGISGCTILGNGNICLIVDIKSLI